MISFMRWEQKTSPILAVVGKTHIEKVSTIVRRYSFFFWLGSICMKSISHSSSEKLPPKNGMDERKKGLQGLLTGGSNSHGAFLDDNLKEGRKAAVEEEGLKELVERSSPSGKIFVNSHQEGFAFESGK